MRQFELKPKILKKPPEGQRILVLSSHPDDDVLGCGGSLIKFSEVADVMAVYFADGSRGTLDRHKEPSLVKIRRQEAEKAGRILGIKKQIFLGLPDWDFQAEGGALEEFSKVLEGVDPEVIYLPHFQDAHRDHQEVSQFLKLACQNWQKEVKLYAYSIWSVALPNVLVDISDVVEQKRKAILAHASQLKNRDYEKAILGLNQYFGQFFNVGEYAEAFYACSLGEYLDKV